VRPEDELRGQEAFVSFGESVREFPNTIGHAKRTGSTPSRPARSRPTTPQPFHLQTDELARQRGTKPPMSTEEMEMASMAGESPTQSLTEGAGPPHSASCFTPPPPTPPRTQQLPASA
jgi:hypothetical protein